ncbi:SRPBCC domain-containing protein [Sphaerisporangium sp. TRM90804]|uniref:SRPBCC family protein n=1 Tax=Sphaerisporangium sp. TRM90804 TaxID=3031113 RepID=UPI00244AD335|nr:SRPBCC domain-containing protein [Sphaerisporangium sp. TRM90804]MDH2429618.1 SRPBCC domain-containing protein [Sphaerisporangium sp. TRM90804]
MKERESGRGTAVVKVRVDRPVAAAWAALTEAAGLGKWFGAADSPLEEGTATRVDFGDGDFFAVRTDLVRAPHLVEFRWRFLGFGPECSIRWRLRETPWGCEITVTDHEPRRDDDGVREMTEGWTDFLGRLGAYLTTGEQSRYVWRGDVDGSLDLPPGPRSPLAPDLVHQWLPIATDGFRPRWFFVVDDEGPRRFEIADWRDDGERELDFKVLLPGALRPTECSVRLRPVGDVLRLSFRHGGWRSLGLPDERARGLRARFASAWVAGIGDLGRRRDGAR